MNEPLRKIRKLAHLVANARYRQALRHGVAAAIEHAPVLRSLECATVLDVGANVGQFALATRVCMPKANVIAFEPLAVPATVFRKVFEQDQKVRLYQVALGPKRQRMAMHVSSKIDSSSLLPITDAQARIFPGTEERATVSVDVEVLEALLPPESIERPALLKLDVQGFELAALRGCLSHLHRFDHVYVECSFLELYEHQPLAEDVMAFLRERGFGLRGVYNPSYDVAGRCVQADFLFASNQP